MSSLRWLFCLSAGLVLGIVAVAQLTLDRGQRYASVGDLPLASGEVLRGARIGYRTYGTLDPKGSNAVLAPTWHQGRAADLEPSVGPGKLLDDEKFFIILVDALANGVSTSPSNAAWQAGTSYPRISILDMVESQRLLLEQLGVRRLRAVVGTSMGGMQALAWGATYPEMVDALVVMAATPGMTAEDIERWERRQQDLLATSPAARVWSALLEGEPRQAVWHARLNPKDWLRQAEAIMAFDLAATSGGSLEKAAKALPPTLIVVSGDDPVFDPGPSLALARRSGVELLMLDGRCGHAAPGCEHELVAKTVSSFLRPSSAKE